LKFFRSNRNAFDPTAGEFKCALVNSRNWSVLFFFVGALVSAFGAGDSGKIRVLLITGGHAYEKEPYLRIYAENSEISVTHLEHTEGTADAWDRADLSACDVVVLYDMPRTITTVQQTKFMEIFAKKKGLVVTHHALVSYPDWPEYERVIGGRWTEPAKDGKSGVKPPGYRHDVDIPVVVSSQKHPVTAGVTDFLIRDEIYWGFRVGADVIPLLTTPHPDSGNPLAWCRAEQTSRVVYLQLGHDPSAYNNPNYRRLLANAIRWAAQRDQR
jgi:type 1 glutamine amidotransferase